MTGQELLDILSKLSAEDLKREVVLPVQHSPTSCQKVAKCNIGGLDSLKSYENVPSLLLGDYGAYHPAFLAHAEVLINKGRDGATFQQGSKNETS